MEGACQWVAAFVGRYNYHHRYSGIKFVICKPEVAWINPVPPKIESKPGRLAMAA